MQIHTATDLIDALRASGLFTPEQFSALLRELRPLGTDPQTLMRQLIQSKRITTYQLRKVIHGKAAELFVGDYVITDKIGEGGMGKVYRAVDSRAGREVALKVVRSNLLGNPVVRGRYEREVRAATQLVHPNIVSVHDAGEVQGRCYLAMEFVDGIDLARLVRNHGVLAVPEACEYIRQAALGLQYAHDLGFIHRDMKPSNIIVSGERHIPEAQGPVHAKILDMGLVRGGGFEEDEGGTDLTRAGTVVGTPDYMAPEQAKNSSTVGHRADLYGLGCTFYFLLTGKPPFPDGSPVEKLLKHQIDAPRPLQALRPDVPKELAEIVARLMAKKPEQRYASARELAGVLEPLTRYSGTSELETPPLGGIAHSAETLPGAAPSTPAQAPPTVPAVASSHPTPRPPKPPRREPPRLAAEPAPFEFAVELPSLPKQSAPRPRRPASPPVRRPAPPSRAPLVIVLVLVAVLILVLAVWVVVKMKRDRDPAPSPKPPAASNEPDTKQPVSNPAKKR